MYSKHEQTRFKSTCLKHQKITHQSKHSTFRSWIGSILKDLTQVILASILARNKPNGPLNFNRPRNVGKNSYKNLNSLHAGLEAAWTDLDANTMRNFCSQFTKRLKAVVKANGGYFEWDQLKQVLIYNTKSVLAYIFFCRNILWPPNSLILLC